MSLTAEPTPAFSAGSEPMIASVAGAITRPRPEEMKPIETTRIQYGTSTGSEPAIPNPTAIDSRPPVTTAFVPKRFTRRAEFGAAIAVNTAKGTVCTPADSGL